MLFLHTQRVVKHQKEAKKKKAKEQDEEEDDNEGIDIEEDEE
jgi:hypothetical protein